MSAAMNPTSLRFKHDSNAVQAVLQRFRQARLVNRPHILVFGVGSYGDVLQVTPLLHSLRERFPSARLTFAHPSASGASLLDGSPDIDEFVQLAADALPVLRQSVLSQSLADLVVDCRYVIEYTVVQPVSRLTPEDLGFICGARGEQNHWLHLVRRFPQDNDSLWKAAAARGWSMHQLMAWTSGFVGRSFDQFRVALEQRDFGVRSNLPELYIAVCNSAWTPSITQGLWTKTLPPEKIARVIAGLATLGYPVVLLGEGSDPAVPGVDIDLRGKSSIREAAAILKDALTFVGPEGGLANLARAVGTRAVVFFGSTPPEFFALKANVNIVPKRCGGCWWTTPTYLDNCPRLQLAPDCVNSISEEEIVAGVREILASQGRSARPARPAAAKSGPADRISAETEETAE